MEENLIPNGKAGGDARAKKLTPEQRSEIARRAAAAKWGTPISRHEGILKVGGWQMPCWVLENEKRIISQRAFMEVVGMRYSSTMPFKERVAELLDYNNRRPASVVEILHAIDNPIKFLTAEQFTAFGYEGGLIVDFCNAVLLARRMGAITGAALMYAEAAERLISSVAKVGIDALIDEATGYQEVRDKEALLDKYLRHEFSAWAKRFPNEFYEQLFRLKGWEWKGMKINRPSCVGSYTNDLVYSRLEVGLLKELQVRNPWLVEKGKRDGYHHTLLTEDFGVPRLAQHLHTLITIMKGFGDKKWERFIEFVDRTLPRKGDSVQMLMEFSDLTD